MLVFIEELSDIRWDLVELSEVRKLGDEQKMLKKGLFMLLEKQV